MVASVSMSDIDWSLDWELYDQSTQRKIGMLEANNREGLQLPHIPSDRIPEFEGECTNWRVLGAHGSSTDYTSSPPKIMQCIDMICDPGLGGD